MSYICHYVLFFGPFILFIFFFFFFFNSKFQLHWQSLHSIFYFYFFNVSLHWNYLKFDSTSKNYGEINFLISWLTSYSVFNGNIHGLNPPTPSYWIIKKKKKKIVKYLLLIIVDKFCSEKYFFSLKSMLGPIELYIYIYIYI